MWQVSTIDDQTNSESRERATSSYEDSQVRQYFKNKQRKNRQSQGFGQGSLHASVHSGVKLHRVAETALINIADETG